MTFAEFLDYQNDVSYDIIDGINYLSVWDRELKVTITFRDFESYLDNVQYCIPSASDLATWECGKKRGKIHSIYKKRFIALQERFIELAREYVNELNRMVTNSFGEV